MKKIKPRIYTRIVLLLSLLVFGIYFAWDNVGDLFQIVRGCAAQGYSNDRYLAYCESEAYGDYEHGAFYLETEPESVARLKKAEVVFLGNSRMQFGFSTKATADFFSNAVAEQPFFLLGFGYGEQHRFSQELIHKLDLHPKVIVIAVDERFFRQELTGPADSVIKSATALSNYKTKLVKQSLHRWLCLDQPDWLKSLHCGRLGSLFRSRRDGAWFSESFREPKVLPFKLKDEKDDKLIAEYSGAAAAFIKTLPVSPRCVIFTSVPVPTWSNSGTIAIAAAVDVDVVTQSRGDDWATLDASHLIAPDAQAYSADVLSKMKSKFEDCGVKFKTNFKESI